MRRKYIGEMEVDGVSVPHYENLETGEIFAVLDEDLTVIIEQKQVDVVKSLYPSKLGGEGENI